MPLLHLARLFPNFAFFAASPSVTYYLLIVLLPLIPAIVLFRFMENMIVVEGPFKGLNVRMGGAFAGYFVVVLVSWQIATSLLVPIWSDIWTVDGNITVSGTAGAPTSTAQAAIMVQGPIFTIENGALNIQQVPIPRDHGSGYPRLIILVPGYSPVTVPLDPDSKHLASYGFGDHQVTYDEDNHHISIGKPIVLDSQ